VTRTRHPALHWVLLACLVTMWSTTYLSIKIALSGFDPLTVIAARLVLGPSPGPGGGGGRRHGLVIAAAERVGGSGGGGGGGIGGVHKEERGGGVHRVVAVVIAATG
jgi:hypothetical protein